MRKRFAALVCAVAAVGLSAGAARAGEVKGPPGTPGTPRTQEQVDLIRTGAPAHASSICAYNGLNDMVLGQGPIGSIVQTPHNQGSPGQAGADAAGSGTPGSPTCGPGSNPELP